MREEKYKTKIIEIDIEKEMWIESIRKGELLKRKIINSKNRSDSILDGEGSKYGFLGEIAYANFYGCDHSNQDDSKINYNHDIIWNGWRGEVKTKRRQSLKIKPHWFCSIAKANTSQRADAYIFCSAYHPEKDEYPSKIWIVGWKEPNKFYENCYEGRKGHIDPTSAMGFRFSADCYNVPIFLLNPPTMKDINGKRIDEKNIRNIFSYNYDIPSTGMDIFDKMKEKQINFDKILV